MCSESSVSYACSAEALPARGMVRSVSFIKSRRTINSRSRSWVSLTRFINLERATPTPRREASGPEELESSQQFVHAPWRNVSEQSEDWSWLLVLFARGPRLQQTHRCPDGQQRTGRGDLHMLPLMQSVHVDYLLLHHANVCFWRPLFLFEYVLFWKIVLNYS